MTWGNFKKKIGSGKGKRTDFRKVEKVTELCKYGFPHDSKAERRHCDGIWLRERAGEIRHIAHEPKIMLADAVEFYPDFLIFDVKQNDEVYEEVKGHVTPAYGTKVKLWKNGHGPDKALREYRIKPWTGVIYLYKTHVPKRSE